jgi:hypothetical protein
MDMAKALQELSAPHGRDEKMVAIIERSARLAGLSYSRCYEIWYRRARRIEHAEVVRIKEALRQKTRLDARNELHELRLRLTRLEAVLSISDEEFHRSEIDAVRDTLCRSS